LSYYPIFPFKSPFEIFLGLRCNKEKKQMQGSSKDMMKMGSDVIEVAYEAIAGHMFESSS